MKVFNITPVAKPRMTRRDKWLSPPRPKVAKYRAFCDEVRLQAQWFVMPTENYHVIFVLPMPMSWSKKKREAMKGTPHQQTPDKDNLEKAFLDALCPVSDAQVWDGRVSKIWGIKGKIVIINIAGQPPLSPMEISEVVRDG